MDVTGKVILTTYEGTPYELCNQRCREWTHPYAYQDNGSTLSNAGCGIFSLANAALQELGYSPAEINAALKGADPNATTEEMVRYALRQMVMKN